MTGIANLRVSRPLCEKILLCLIVLLGPLATSGSAQSRSATDGTTPLALASGAPAGSSALSGFENINPYNGNLNFSLPMLSMSGRGETGYTMMLNIERHWRVEHSIVTSGGVGCDPAGPCPTSSYDFFLPMTDSWSAVPAWSGPPGPGTVQVRYEGLPASTCEGLYKRALTRLTFTAPDGTEYELRDQLNGGKPVTAALINVCNARDVSRGTIFITADGTAATFVSDYEIFDEHGAGVAVDYPSGYLMMRDGTRYRIDNGTVSWQRDRNGNQTRFSYDGFRRVTLITDSLNRQVAVSYATTTPGCDQINFKGFGGAARTMRVWHTSLSGALRADSSLLSDAQLFSQLNGASGTDNPTVTSALELPDGRLYQFYYNSYQELARVILPTGGAIEYDYAAGVAGDSLNGVIQRTSNNTNNQYQIYRRVIERRLYSNGVALENKTTFSRPEQIGSNSGVVQVDQFNSSGSLLASEKHYYYGSPTESLYLGPLSYPAWNDGKEYKTERFNTDGTNPTTMLRRVEHTWQPGTPISSNPTASINGRIVETVTTLGETNQVSKQSSINPQDGSIGFDQFNNQTDVWEYDFGAGAPGTLVRRAHTNYVTGTNYIDATGAHLRSLATQASIYDASGVERARTTFEYDNYNVDSNHAPLISRTTISGFDSAFTTSYTNRGNATTTTLYLLNTSGSVTGSVSAYAQYDIAGNIVKAIDGLGHATTLDYSDRFGAPDGEAQSNSAPGLLAGLTSYAFATSATNALGHTSYTQFDFYLGRPVDAKDANGAVTSIRYGTVENDSYVDLLDRPTQLIRGANTGNPTHSQTTTKYNDANHLITTTSDRDSYQDNLLKSQALYDGLGRTVRALTYENQDVNNPWLTSDTQYDALGRAWRGSNPYRSTGYTDTVNPSGLWTTTAFDALGRGVSVTTPDSAVVNSYYNGNQVLVKDQAGKERMSQTNALGQLSDVWEITAADDSTEAITFPSRTEVTNGYRSKYAYDTLGNLITVTQQKGPAGTLQTRTFVYDSLKRLLSATNPESGAVNYIYDSTGNLVVKTDARSVSSHYEYDLLNRVTRRWYNGGNSVSNTVNNSPALPGGVGASDEVKYFYDSATMPSGAPTFTRGSATGRLVATTYGGGSSGNYFGYDELGQSLLSIQQTGGINYETNATYNKAGAPLTETYPSRRVVTNTYDAAGRSASVAGNLGDAANRTYATGIRYSPFGGMELEQFGTDTAIYNKLQYNVRGQLWDVRVSTGSDANGTWNRGALQFFYDQTYSFGGSGTDNNGNVLASKHYRPLDEASSTWAISTDTYSYDALNRLTSVSENFVDSWHIEAPQFVQGYLYDRYGNRTINQTTTSSAVNKKDFTVSAVNNRLGVPGGSPIGTMTYDSAGNLTTDTYSGSGVTREYDAENRMTKETQAGSYVAGSYSYDANGQRVRRTANGVETWQVYGIGGELLAEYPVNGPIASPQREYGYRNGQLLVRAEPAAQINWLVADQLGTPRIIIDKTGALANVKRHDYLPFGEELFAGTGNRTTGLGYSGDNVRQKFASYERDNETALDYAQARHFSSSQGRFTSSDSYVIFFEMKAGRNERERSQILRAYVSEPQNWNRYSYVLNDPVNLIDPSGLKWLTKDNQNYQWVDDDKYREEDWKGYEIAEAGTIAYFGEGWGGYQDKYKGLMGSYVTLNADGSMSSAGITPDNDDEPSSSGYGDINISYGSPYFIGITGGLMFDRNGSYPYIGGGMMNPGLGASGTGSNDNVSGGYNMELQGGYGPLYGSVGTDQEGNTFLTHGAGYGASATAYYVFGAPHPRPGPHRPTDNNALNSNSNRRGTERPGRSNCACNR